MTIEDNIARLREAPHGYVLVRAYSGCGAYADDAPGLRIQCQTKLRVGAPCEKCPQGESPKVIAALLAAWDEREAMRKDAKRIGELAKNLTSAIKFKAAALTSGDAPKVLFADERMWAAVEAIDAAMQEHQA